MEELEAAVTEGETLKVSLGEEWLEQVVETASMHSTLEQSRVLEEFCRRVGLSVAAVEERVWRMEREGQLERMFEGPLGISEVGEFMWEHQLMESGVEILCRRGEAGRVKKACV